MCGGEGYSIKQSRQFFIVNLGIINLGVKRGEKILEIYVVVSFRFLLLLLIN